MFHALSSVNGWLWNHFLLVLIAGVGVYFAICLKVRPLFAIRYVMYQAFRKKDLKPQGEISPLESLMLSLSPTLGMSSMIGVSTAVILGGFGAVFWMLLIGIFGLFLRYAESLLAIKYRSVNSQGEVCGGPIFYISIGLKKKWLGVCFALFGLLAALIGGTAIQAHSVALTLRDAVHVPPMMTGVLLLIPSIIVLLGGIKRIARCATTLGSTTVLLYAACGLIILLKHHDCIFKAFHELLTSAFSARAAGGGMLGASLFALMQLGTTWGVISHQIGWGTASIAAAAAKTDVPARQALIATGGAFLCLLLNLMTALVLFVTDAPALIQSSSGIFTACSFVAQAFHSSIPFGDVLVTGSLFIFGLIGIMASGYYGERCLEFLSGKKHTVVYRVVLCSCIFIGSYCSIDALWPLSNCILGCLTLCNLFALLALSSVVMIETRLFLDLIGKEKRQKASAELGLVKE